MIENSESVLKAKDLNQQGVLLFKVGNVDEAIKKYNEAIDTEPMLVDSYKNLGDLCLKTEKYHEAKNNYKKALLIEKRGDIYFQYGNACFMNDEPHEGLENYNKAISEGFDSDEMFFFMAMAYEHLNDDRMALRYVQKAMLKNPSRPDYKVKKVDILLRLNMIEDAKEEVENILLNDPELYDGYHMKTVILWYEGNYKAALSNAKMASDKFPEDADLYYDYAKSLALDGKYTEAISSLEHAKELKYFSDAKAKFLLLEAEMQAEQGNIDESIIKCKECIGLETEEVPLTEARFMMINLALTKSMFEEALSQAEEIIKKKQKDSFYFAALYFRPYSMRKLGREEEAIKYYKEAVAFYRLATLQKAEALDAYLYRIMCLRDIEEYDKALELLEFLENLDSSIAEIYTLRADIYNLTNQDALMKEALEKAYEIKPELRDSLREVGE